MIIIIWHDIEQKESDSVLIKNLGSSQDRKWEVAGKFYMNMHIPQKWRFDFGDLDTYLGSYCWPN